MEKPKKRIFLVDEHQVVGYPGGIERVLCDMANAFSLQEYEIFLVCMNAEDGMPYFPLVDKVHFYNLSFRGEENPFQSVKWQWKRVEREALRGLAGKKFTIWGHHFEDPKEVYRFHHFVKRLHNLIIEIHPDLFLAITPTTVRIIRAALDHLNIPIVGMFHSYVSELDNFTEKDWEAWRSCACIQVLQPSFADAIRAHGIKNVVVIPNAIPAVGYDQRSHLEEVHHRIVTVGRLEGTGKRQHLLIETFAKLADKFPDWQVEIYGNTDNRRYRERLEKEIEKYGLGGRVHLNGTTNDLSAVYQQADVFAFPSKNEGFGLAVMEAMSYGLPVVAFQECYEDDYIVADGMTGFLCENMNVFERKLEQLMEDQALRISLGKAAYQKSKAFFSDNIWKQWKQIFVSLMRDKMGEYGYA